MRSGFRKRSCADEERKRDDDSRKDHPALAHYQRAPTPFRIATASGGNDAASGMLPPPEAALLSRRVQTHRPADAGQSQRARTLAAIAPNICAATKGNTPDGAIPENVSESERASVTAGLANEVEAVNQ